MVLELASNLGMKNREKLYLYVGDGVVRKCVLKITARRKKDVVLSIPMAIPANFHTTRKASILHNTTVNARPNLRRYFELERPDIQSLKSVELLKCFEVSTSIFDSETYPACVMKEPAVPLSDSLVKNIFVGVLLGPTDAIKAESIRMSNFSDVSLWARNLAGFDVLIVGQRTNRVGGDVFCDATRYYTSVHEGSGVGAYKEDFVYYL